MERRKKLMLLLIVCLLQVVGYAAKVNTLTIYFAKDKYMVTGDEGQKLYALKNADLIMLHGHTDADGSNAYNEQLSVNRVNEVKRIVAQICPKARIETKHYGEYEPINGNEDEVAKTANRRVEISYISDPLLSTKVPVQTFSIDTRKEQTITCKQGTQVVIPAGAFAGANVTISVSEYYDPLQIFSANLSTKCNGSPIETAGMIYITAEANGRNIEPSKELQYKFPRSNMKKDFKFFEGERGADYNINWVLPSKKKAAGSASLNGAGLVLSVNDTLLVRNRMIRTNESNFGGLKLTTTIDGVVRKEFDAVRDKMADAYSNTDFVEVQGCLNNATVEINIAADGRITGINTNYTNISTECDRPIQTFIRRYLPQRFSPVGGDTKIKMMFIPKSDAIQSIISYMHGGFDLTEDEKAAYTTDEIILSANKLGWINCDRFIGQQTVVTYAVKAEPDATVRCVMNNYNAYFTAGITGYATNGKDTMFQCAFQNIPANEPITLINTRNKDGKIYLAIASATTKKGLDNIAFNYEEVTKEELEFRVSKLKFVSQ